MFIDYALPKISPQLLGARCSSRLMNFSAHFAPLELRSLSFLSVYKHSAPPELTSRVRQPLGGIVLRKLQQLVLERIAKLVNIFQLDDFLKGIHPRDFRTLNQQFVRRTDGRNR